MLVDYKWILGVFKSESCAYAPIEGTVGFHVVN